MNRSFILRPIPGACLLAFSLFNIAQAQQSAPLTSGIDRTTADASVRIQDDAFLAVEGKWLTHTPIPADRNLTGSAEKLYDETQTQLRELVENLATEPTANPTSAADAKKIGDLYATFMDEARIELLGIKPVAADLAKIDALQSKADLAAFIGEYDRLGVDMPLSGQVHQDAKDSSKYVIDLVQGGIGLPNRDYLLTKTDKILAGIRVKYEAYLTRLLKMADDKDAAAKAKAVVALETMIAQAQWSEVENRDPVKTYNVVAIHDLARLAPHFDWARYLGATELAGKTDSVVISQPTYLQGFDKLVASVPMATWKAYFKTRFLTAYAPYLSKDFVDARFAFVNTALRGTPENPARWKRGVLLIESSLGEALGQLYVARYFPPESKARMDQMVKNLLASYKVSIDGLDWMGPETKKEAQAKLATFMPKIGHPVRWRDYSTLRIARDDLVGDVKNAKTFEYRRNIDHLGKPIDRDEWYMTPQTLDAYYNGERNEIVFPAALLQPPFFDAKADDAANYGAIGAVIGHEISHGFDDRGSKYDGKGNMRDWWTPEDRTRFNAKTHALIEQYNAYSPLPGYTLNGVLTLGENIADNSGLAIAFKAYHLSLNGKPAPVIDGLTGDQRFFMGFVQAWKQKIRDATLIMAIKSNSHSPGQSRTNGALTNQPGFHEAFGVRPGDRMYTAPEKRVIIW